MYQDWSRRWGSVAEVGSTGDLSVPRLLMEAGSVDIVVSTEDLAVTLLDLDCGPGL